MELLARRVGERVVKVLREYDAAAIEEVFSDGLLNVMEAPEFAQSDKLRRVFSALENRAYLGELVGSVAVAGRVQVFIGHENQPLDMRDVSLVLAPYGRPGRAMGVVGVLGPDADVLLPGDRHGPLRVGPHERARGSPLCLTDTGPAPSNARTTSTSRRPRWSPRSRRSPRSATRRARPPTTTSARSSANGPSSRTSSGGRPRSGCASSGSPARTSSARCSCVADDFDRAIEARPASIAEDAWFEGIAAIDRKLRLLLESEGVTAIDAAPGRPFDPREHEAIANVPGTDRPEGEIVEEIRRGYRLRDRVIRPALVAVATTADSKPN